MAWRPRRSARGTSWPAQVRDWPQAPRSSATRSSRRRRAAQAAARSSRSATRHRGPRRPLGARPGAPDPRGVAGERQAPHALSYGRVPRRDPDPGAGPDRHLVLGVQELPDILNRWGHDLPPERVHLVTVPRRRAGPQPAVEAVQPGLRPRRARPRPRGGARATRRSAYPRRRCPPDQPTANREVNRRDYRPLVRELLAHQTLSRARRHPGCALPPDAYPWARRSRRPGIAEIERRGVRRGRRPPRPGRSRPAAEPQYADPDSRRRGRSRRRAAVDAIKALLLESARQRRRGGAAEGELRETSWRLRAVLPAADVPLARKVVRRLERGRPAAGCSRGLPRVRGRSSRRRSGRSRQVLEAVARPAEPPPTTGTRRRW